MSKQECVTWNSGFLGYKNPKMVIGIKVSFDPKKYRFNGRKGKFEKV
jgi:hypothetical protein